MERSCVILTMGSGSTTSRGRSVYMPLTRRTRDFESEVRPHLAVLYRVAKRLTRHAEDAEDVVGQTLVNAYGAWSRFDGQHVRSWLIKIMRNEFLNRRRKQGHQPREAELDDQAAEERVLWAEVARKLDAQRLLEEIDRLPEEYRMAVLLCDVEELSYEEAADAMDVPIGTVRSRLFRGRTRLKERVGASLGEDPR